ADDIHTDERITFKDELLAMGVKSILCVPLIVKGNAIGVIGLCLPYKEDSSNLEYKIPLLTIFAGQSAIAIENTRMYEQLERANEQIRDWNERLQQKVEATTQKLIASRERLWHAERLSTVGRLVAGLVHEINNPLYAISNYAQRLIELEKEDGYRNTGLSEETKLKYLEAIEQGVNMIKGITENLLELTRLSSLSKEFTDINELLQDTIALVEFDAQEQGVLVKQELDTRLPPTESDAAKLRQVFLNLLINALDAMQEGGTITVKTQGLPDHVSIMISDTGVGIGEEDLPHIFEPYFSTKEDEGIGLGLFVSASIIQAHDGKITVESEKDVGTCFKIILPVES
ncbi:MAG: ATP-binding protein, partial [Candidatus Poribacteria bacterium]